MSPESLRIMRLAVLGSISILPLLILPTMVGALVDYAGFSEARAGWAAAAGGAGGALAAIAIALRIRHLDPHRLAIVGLITLAVFDTASMFAAGASYPLFLAARVLAGIGGAAAYAAVMASYAELPNSERGYGAFVMLQFTLSALGLYALPLLLPEIGVTGLFLGMAACALLGLTQVRPVVHRAAINNGETIEIRMLVRPAAVLVMLGIGLFEAANNMHFTYADRIGIDRGLELTTVGEILGISTVIGIPAAFAVVWLGDRYGEAKPIAAALATAIAGLGLLLWSDSPVTYVTAMCLLSIAWAFGLPYFQAFEARLDPGGSVVVAGGFFTAAGAMLGPALAAMLVMPGEYSAVLGVAAGIYVVVGVLVGGAARFSVKT